eukprot:362746_1
MSFDSYDACFVAFIYTAIVLVFAWPLYFYLLTEWYRHRDHFVIRNRWPKISLIIVAFTIIIEILFIAESAFCWTGLNQVSMGLANGIQGLVYYRAYLLYARTVKTRLFLKMMTSTHVVATDREHHKTC